MKACAWAMAGLLMAQPAMAAVTRIPSCYQALHIAPPARGATTTLFVLIDQTVSFDAALTQSLVRNALALVRPGNAFEVVVFSAFNQNRYMDVTAAGTLERPLPPAQRNATGMDDLRNLDICMARQADYGRRLTGSAVTKALAGASPSLSRSDIIGSLAEAARHIRDAGGGRKVVLIASDMLENSAVTSFYRQGGVRTIAPAAELDRVRAAGMLGDFGGADVYVIGAALLPPLQASAETQATMQSYRSPVMLRALRQFWSLYFQASHARLVEFGTPALLTPLQ